MEIELFYMSHSQRHNDKWFPDWMYVLNSFNIIKVLKSLLITKFYLIIFSYYTIPVEEVRKLINAIDDHRTQFNSPPFTLFISKKLRNLAGISELKKTVNEKKLVEVQQQIENKLEQTNN